MDICSRCLKKGEYEQDLWKKKDSEDLLCEDCMEILAERKIDKSEDKED